MARYRIDLSHEFVLTRFRQGVKLIKPDAVSLMSPYIIETVDHIMALPMNFYFLTKDSNIVKVNEHTVLTCGYDSEKKALGQSVYNVATEVSAARIISNDKRVIKKQMTYIMEEILVPKQEKARLALSLKYPWYDQNNEVAGVFGCSILLNVANVPPLAHALTQLMLLGLLNRTWRTNNHVLASHFPYTFTEQECEILQMTVRGFNAKMIAKFFGLSPRTIEHKLERIKTKANVKSKAELIARFFDLIKNNDK